jgi:hypothetical protein
LSNDKQQLRETSSASLDLALAFCNRHQVLPLDAPAVGYYAIA